MKTRRRGWLTTIRDESGQTMVEYALVAALIAVVCLLAVSELGTAVVGVFERIRDEIAAV